MAARLTLRFVSSYADPTKMPATRAELALVGRSNVGKSTLLNALARQHQLARTSKSPGATRLLNAFELGPENSRRWLVDLPGYGYAKASHAEQRRWNAMTEQYLTHREPLRGVLHLIDAEIGPTSLDILTVEWLQDVGLPVTYVATKADKLRPSRRGSQRRKLTTRLNINNNDLYWTSANKNTGIPDLRKLIATLLD